MQPYDDENRPEEDFELEGEAVSGDDSEVALTAEEEFNQKLAAIVESLESEAESRVAKRQTVEQRWLEDLRQYHGNSEHLGAVKDETNAVSSRGTDEARSNLNINLTRSKTNAFSAKLTDLLFPTDDKNWGIKPTPVPELAEEAKRVADEAVALAEQAAQAEEQAANAAAAQQQGAAIDPATMQGIEAQAQRARTLADTMAQRAKELQAHIDEAKKRAERMSQEIEDQFTECQYAAQARDAIEDAAKIGTGIMEGPVVGDRVRAKWIKREVQDDATGEVIATEHVMEQGGDPKPRYRRVDYWNFFPDPDARKVEDSERNYVRELLNRKGMRKLARVPGFSKEAIKRLIGKGNKPKGTLPSYLNELRSITGEHESTTDERFTVWKMTGPLDCEDIRVLAEAMGQTIDEYEDDPLLEINAVVWFCDGELLKFAIYPLDSGEGIYSAFNLEKDEASLWGYGIPYIMRHPQAALAASWRMMLDNAGLSVGPQIVIDKEKLEPADNDWVLRPRKIWWARNGIPKDERPFQSFNIEMHQQELAGLIALCKQHIDDETSMPALAQGEQGANVTKTAQGMAILMNSTNVVFRRVVKNFDDDMTTPNVRRAYDWNMQFSPKEEIKGDFEVNAVGASVLLVREMQAQNLMVLALQFGGHPVYGIMLKHANVLRSIFKAHMLPADEHVLDDEAIEKAQARLAEQMAAEGAAAGAKGKTPEELEFERERLAAEVEIANMEAAARRYVADKAYETTMSRVAEDLNMNIDTIRGKIKDNREARAHKERIVAAEAAMAARTGVHAEGVI